MNTEFAVSWKTSDCGDRKSDKETVRGFQAFPQTEQEQSALIERLQAGDVFDIECENRTLDKTQ